MRDTLFRTDNTVGALISAILHHFGLNSVKDIIKRVIKLLKKELRLSDFQVPAKNKLNEKKNIKKTKTKKKGSSG